MILIYKVLLCDPCKVFHALCNGLSEPVEHGNNHWKTVMTLFLFRMWTWEGCRVIFKVFLMSILHKDDVVIMRASSQMNKLQVKCDWICDMSCSSSRVSSLSLCILYRPAIKRILAHIRALLGRFVRMISKLAVAISSSRSYLFISFY